MLIANNHLYLITPNMLSSVLNSVGQIGADKPAQFYSIDLLNHGEKHLQRSMLLN